MGFVDELKKCHMDMLAAVENLTAEEMSRENTIGEWSVRDVILHIAMWEGEALKGLAVWRTGHDPDWSYIKSIQMFNDFWIDSAAKMTVEQVMRMFNLIHHAVIAEVSAIPEDIWPKRGGIPGWLRDETTNHFEEHIPKLQAYKKSLGK